jgi:mono/diheme cytochrome c family protein
MVALRVRPHRLVAIAAILVLVGAFAATAQLRVTERDMHSFPGGVPPGWKFALPAGDPVKGKQVFAALECYTCHLMAGQGFPEPKADKPGPALAGMGGMHPAEYFAESIVNPDAVIIDGPGFLAADGRSRMPSFNDSLTVAQLVDLVAYLKSLTGGDHHHHHGGERDKIAGEYRVRIAYDEPSRPSGAGVVRVFVSDAETGAAVPYLPVTVRIGTGKAARQVALRPVLGALYGAAARVPDDTESVTVLIGPTTADVAVTPRKYGSARRVTFAW